MEPTERILIRTYGLMLDADLAAGQLRAQGIECEIRTDDCAGMYPSLGVIQLLVAPEDAEDARRILREEAVALRPAVGLPTESSSRTALAPPARVYRFNSGVVVGVILGILLHFGYRHYEVHRDRTDRYYNKAGTLLEEEIVWRNGQMVERRFDRNGDGRWDEKIFFKDGLAVSEELDENFDGKWDATLSFSARGFFSGGQYDTDYNGVSDFTATYTNGVAHRSDWRPNGTNVILLRQIFHLGVLDEELRDQNGDGLFDVSIKFDPFNTPIRTNSLRPTTQSP